MPRADGRGGVGAKTTPGDLAALDRIVATVRPLGLDPPVVIEPPAAGSDDWAAKSMTPNRPRRVDLVVDGKTGAIKGRKDFADRHLIDRIVGTGVAAHEGRLFGWPNQLLGLITAIGLILLCVSAGVLWWRRREPGVLGGPQGARPSPALGRPAHARRALRNLSAALRCVARPGVAPGGDRSAPGYRGFATGWDSRSPLLARGPSRRRSRDEMGMPRESTSRDSRRACQASVSR